VTSDGQPSTTGSEAAQARVLIVVPTLGQRIDFLRRTLASIQGQSVPVDIVVVAPGTALEARALADEVGASVLDDPGGLSAAINLGLMQAHAHHEYVNWLGDDDTLTKGSLAAVSAALDANHRASVAFGQCLYVDEDDNPLWVSQAGRAAPWILPWGPDLVPQPGMLIRRAAWQAVGGLDESLRFAMDLDLLLKLKRWGPLVAVPRIVSTFRWHVESLTVSDRTASLAESEAVKRRYLPKALIPMAPSWEAPVRWATRRAAATVNERAT
jgi:GT2 family glycosyltransferase